MIHALLVLSIGFSLLAPTSATSSEKVRSRSACGECAALKRVGEKFKSESKKKMPDTGPLSAEGAKLILAMTSSGAALSEEELTAIVDFYRIAVTRDPVRAVLELSLPALKAHRKAIEAKVKTLPKSESEEILEAITIATSEEPADYPEGFKATPPPEH